MELERTIDMGGFFIKKYRDESPINPVEFVQNLRNLGIIIRDIKVKESVESDMKSLDGATFSSDDFLYQYDRIIAQARDASFEIEILYNDLPTFITIADKSNTIALTTVVEDLDLNEITQKKTNSFRF